MNKILRGCLSLLVVAGVAFTAGCGGGGGGGGSTGSSTYTISGTISNPNAGDIYTATYGVAGSCPIKVIASVKSDSSYSFSLPIPAGSVNSTGTFELVDSHNTVYNEVTYTSAQVEQNINLGDFQLSMPDLPCNF